MKRLLSAMIAVLAVASVFAADKNEQISNGNYFEEFTAGKVVLKNNTYAKGKFNYNCITREMHFMQNGVDMVVTNLGDIDSVMIDGHKFVPHADHFAELYENGGAQLFVDWKLETKEVGKRGAMGIVNQSGMGVRAVNVNALYCTTNKDSDDDLNVFKTLYNNTYYFVYKDRLRKFTNEKEFYNLFNKQQREELKAFSKNEKIDWQDPNSLLIMVSKAITLE